MNHEARLKRLEVDVPRAVGFALFEDTRRPGETAAAALERFGFHDPAARIPAMTLDEMAEALDPVMERAGESAWTWAVELCTDAQLMAWDARLAEEERNPPCETRTVSPASSGPCRQRTRGRRRR